jgi:alginate biosynthesis protein AlgX
MIRSLILGCIVVLFALPAASQSVYGCSDLAGRIRIPSVEGSHGVFYRIDTDLHMFHPMSDETIAQLAELSQALAALGTTLIYVPLPTKSLSMPDQLPQAARDLGFDLATATTVHDEMIRRLTEGGVLTTNLRVPLRTAPEAQPSFFGTDYRMTPAGARRAAEALAAVIAATPGFDALPKSRFETRSTGSTVIPSDMYNILQRHCTATLPFVETEIFATTRFQAGAVQGDNTIFGAATANARIALLGTEYTGGALANMSGFLAENTGLDVIEYVVDGGGSFAAMSSYLTSRAFAEARPAYLIWANPEFNNLAQYGDQPLRELIAAAGANCSVSLPLATGFEANAISADLRSLAPGQSYTLFVDADGAPAAEARFDFTGADGLVTTRSISRVPTQVPTGRFFMSLAGMGQSAAQTVRIALDVPFGINARVAACFD